MNTPDRNLAPAIGTPERAVYYQRCVFACAELDPPIMMFINNTMRPLEYMRPPGEQHDAKLAARGRDFAARADILSHVLSDRDYLLGTDFSGADILIGHCCFMATVTELIGDYPALEAYYARLQQARPRSSQARRSDSAAALDRRLPLPEWFSVSPSSARRINAAKLKGKNIVALGTTVARALESSMVARGVEAQSGLTDLKLDARYRLRVTDSLITGMHKPGSSHLELLAAFSPKQELERLYDSARKRGFLAHEYGDLSFIEGKVA